MVPQFQQSKKPNFPRYVTHKISAFPVLYFEAGSQSLTSVRQP